MCDGGHEQGKVRTGVFMDLARQPGVPLARRLRSITVNLARRLRGARLNDCCGRYGDPGC